MVEIYKGKEITTTQVEKLKEIAKAKYSPVIYDDYFAGVKTPSQLAYLHDVNEDSEALILGTGWFLCYSESHFVVELLEWVAVDDVNKMQQFAEMVYAFKHIFLNNPNKIFKADMRHDTSYAIYSKMLERGLFNEFAHKYMLDDVLLPPEVYDIKESLVDRFCSIEEFLDSGESNQFSDYFQYILHRVMFYPTQRFVNKYGQEKSFQKKYSNKNKKSNS